MPMLRFPSPPRKGRIPPGPRSRHRCCRFQSPPREGRIVQNSGTTSSTSVFPVTSPRGEDPPSGRLQTSGHSFQSPPREGRIYNHSWSKILPAGFQSPPREGRIMVRRYRFSNDWRFPVTSPRGEDRRPCPCHAKARARFQSPPREGRIPAVRRPHDGR